ncbi:MAG: S-adenosylmethionine synthase [Lentisphaerae bacterium ADurb.BinA184]|nr:MAG: S-adenosylmethionine synthase [Lentisphaerae bacterium ADurb.BinA184]
MSKIRQRHVYTSESVSEGHPDKICDQISDAVLDACLEQDPESRVASENLVTTDLIVMAGEITTQAQVNWEQLGRRVVREIGYTCPDIGFSADSCKVFVSLHQQSPDISLGVTAKTNQDREQGAGDQGMMYGYASNETEQLMPATILYAHNIVRRLAELRHRQPKKYPYLRPDAKSQVSFLYDNGKPVELQTVVVSHQHRPDMPKDWLLEVVRDVVAREVPKRFLHDRIQYLINPTGRFVVGGPHGDTGLTGRKIIVDTYGGVGCHGGGAFSGKDPSKVDRSAAYMCRYVAKNIVAAGLAGKCELQVAYAIGVARPLSLNVETFGTGVVDELRLGQLIFDSGLFDFRPAEIIRKLGLKTPHKNGWCYREAAAYGHFGREQFPWEKTDMADALRTAAKGI